MSRTFTRAHGKGIGPLKRPPLDAKAFQAACDRAIDIMAAGIQDDIELEAILAKARPETRAAIRARLEPHLTYRNQPTISPLADSIRDSMKSDGSGTN